MPCKVCDENDLCALIYATSIIIIIPPISGVSAETKRNTQHNESLISNSYKRARDKLNLSDEDSAKEAPGGSPSASLLPPSTAIHLRGSVTGGRAVPSRAKSPSDLEVRGSMNKSFYVC